MSPRTLRVDSSLSSIGDTWDPRVRRYTPMVCFGDLILILSGKMPRTTAGRQCTNPLHRIHTIQIQSRNRDLLLITANLGIVSRCNSELTKAAATRCVVIELISP